MKAASILCATLTTEAGLSDRPAFPFVYLGIAVASAGGGLSLELAREWPLRGLIDRAVVGGLTGAGVGWLLKEVLFDCRGRTPFPGLAQGWWLLPGFCSPTVPKRVEGYGFIAAF